MECLRCHNQEEKYFFKDKDVYYCRKCIAFGRIDVGNKPIAKTYCKKKLNVHYHLSYSLTSYQQKAASQLKWKLQQKQDVLIYAATGAGKTEIVMGAIEMYLREGKKVGIAISRRQVVLEIKERMQKAFSTIDVIAVCEGHTKKVDADLIVCTMHQLYRYYQSFDLLIMDEVDAFPYRGNSVLEAIAKHACCGEVVYLSATPDLQMLEEVKQHRLQMIPLFKRPHGYPLIVPRIYLLPSFIQYMYLFAFLWKQHKKAKQTLVFVPTIKMAMYFEWFLSFFFACAAITSKTKNKDILYQNMKNKKLSFLIATTILERGITIEGVDVLVLHADHIVFHEASLIQIVGRVGRSMQYPFGEAILLARRKSNAMKKCKQMIVKMNEGGE